MYFKVDMKNILRNKIVLIAIAFLLVISIFDPITTYLNGVRYGVEYYGNLGSNFYHFWLPMNCVSWGGDLYNILYNIFPIIFTGMVFYMENSSSMMKCMLVRGKRANYYLSKILSVMVFSSIVVFAVLLINFLITYMLFPQDFASISDWYKPNEGSFTGVLFAISPILSCIGYLVINALLMGFLSGIVTGLHSVIKFPNVYVAMIVPVIVIYVWNFIFDAMPMLSRYSVNYIRQPATSYAMSLVIGWRECIIGMGIVLIVGLVLYIAGIVRSRDIL